MASLDGKYLLSYNPDIEPNNEGESVKEIPLSIKSVVSVGATLYYLMNKAGVKEKYGSNFVRNCIQMLTKETI